MGIKENGLKKKSKWWENQTTLPASWEICIQVKKQQVKGQQAASKLGKNYGKAAFFHPAYLTYMQCTTYKMPGWMKHKVDLKLLGVISINSEK